VTLLLRKSNVQARIEGWVQCSGDEDYCVLEDERLVGRIYADVILAWLNGPQSVAPATSCLSRLKRTGDRNSAAAASIGPMAVPSDALCRATRSRQHVLPGSLF